MGLKGLVFDFDGLILDTETPRYQAWQEIYSQRGLAFSMQDYSNTIGSNNAAYDPIGELSKFVQDAEERMDLIRQQQQRELEILKEQSILPGVLELLDEAVKMNLGLAIASSSDRAWVISNLEKLRIQDYFDAVWTEDEVENVKPDPELFIKATNSLGLAAHEVIAFEDSPNGVKAAKAAGIFTVVVPNRITMLLDTSRADLPLKSLSDFHLKEMMDHFNTRRI